MPSRIDSVLIVGGRALSALLSEAGRVAHSLDVKMPVSRHRAVQ
jgi:hypothetical protein